ncbi:MAG TPA: hypothetical protein VGO11_09775 [Chthoniobacteraceae bacterium]|jgi:hypothetical protein|nr:hypothetical protein [Chthoniobacteraceae bacterium]
MVHRVAVFLLALGVAAQARIEFTPTPFFVQFEGFRVQQPGFRDGEALVTFAPPSGWTLDGAGAVLNLVPKDFAMAMARVESRRLGTAAVDAEESLKFARDYFAQMLPNGATGLKWEPEVERNPVLLNKHETVRLEATYSAVGQSFRATVILCNLADQQLIFVVGGRERDFPKLYEAWRRSLFTWQGLK